MDAYEFLFGARAELIAEIREGKPIADLAEELSEEETAGELSADEVEIELWRLMREDLETAATKAGEDAASAAQDALPTWPRDGAIDAEGIARLAKVKGSPRGDALDRICKAFREGYAEKRAELEASK